MPLWKKLFRTLLEKKAQYLSAWFLVVVSSMLFYSFTASGANLIDNLNHFFSTNKVEDAQFVVSDPIQDIQSIESKFNVQIEERFSKDTALDSDTTLRLLNETDVVNQYTLIDGKKLEKSNELLVDSSFLKEHQLHLGDTLTVGGEEFSINGTMAIPDYVYPLKSVSSFLKNPQSFGVAVIQEAAIKEMSGVHSYYSIRFNESNEKGLKTYLNETNHISDWIDNANNNRISFIRGDIQAIKITGETLPIGLLLITIVIIMILLWRLLKKEYVQIGTLYALGYKKSEIMRHYVYYAISLAVFGSVVGTALGWFLMHPLLSMFASFYNLPILVIKPHVMYLLASLILPAIFFVPLTYILVNKVLKVPPVVLMKGGELKTKVSGLERAFNMKRFTFSTRFKIREVLRNLSRLMFLTVGVIFSSLLILSGFVMSDSMDYLVNDNFERVYHYNYHYVLNQVQTDAPESGQVAASAPAILKNKDDHSVQVVGLKPDNSAINLANINGDPLSFDSVIINKSLADQLNINPGDSLKVHNQLNNKVFTVEVDHIANSYLGDMIYIPLKQFNNLNGMPEESYTEIYSNEKLNINSEILMATTSTNSTIEGYKELIQPVKYAVGGLAAGAGVIAIVIIYILISLLIEENSFKISLMKVIGYEYRSIRKLMIDFNIWFVILGFAIGIPVTLASMSAFLSSITAEMNLTIPVQIDWTNVVFGFVIILIAYFISILLNQRKLKQISMHEAINRSTE